jgi:hypothetical protein
MKNVLLALATLFVLTTNTFAATISLNGAEATKLRASLIKAGAEIEMRIETSLIRVSNISCSTESGFVLMPLKCKFVDENSTQHIELIGAKAVSLRAALIQTGLKEFSTCSGELSRSSIGAKSIDCSTSVIHGVVFHCDVK